MKTSFWIRTVMVVAVMMPCAWLALARGVDLLATNVQSQQRPGTGLVDITYDLETIGESPVTVRLFLSTDAGASYPYLCRAVSGNVGPGVEPGTDRQIVWDAGADFPGFSSTACQLRVTADDAPNLHHFTYVAPGTFMMGSPDDEWVHENMETLHQVTLTHGIDMQITEVTNQQYMELAQWAYDQGYVTVTNAGLYDNLDDSTGFLKGLSSADHEISFSDGVFSCINPSQPVKYVTWSGSAAYCDWLSLQQGLPRAYNHATWQCNQGNPYGAAGYRLPTEAEWEYACRAGTQTMFYTGSCLSSDSQGNYRGSYPAIDCTSGPYEEWTVPVGSYQPNGNCLFDMHGNVFEWCNDWYGTYEGTVTNPVGPVAGGSRILRGGGYFSGAGDCRSAHRYLSGQGLIDDGYGFRPVRSTD